MYVRNPQSAFTGRLRGMGGTVTIQTTGQGAGGQQQVFTRVIADTDPIPAGWTVVSTGADLTSGGTNALKCVAPQKLSADGKSCVDGALTCAAPLALSADGKTCVAPTSVTTSSISSFFSNLFAPGSALASIPVASIPIPLWGWLAAGVGAFYVFGGKSAPARGRR